MKDAKILLELLTEAVTPGRDQHHCITLNDNGSLQVSLMLGHTYLPILLEPTDFEMPVKELADQLISIEIGDAPQQY